MAKNFLFHSSLNGKIINYTSFKFFMPCFNHKVIESVSSYCNKAVRSDVTRGTDNREKMGIILC